MVLDPVGTGHANDHRETDSERLDAISDFNEISSIECLYCHGREFSRSIVR